MARKTNKVSYRFSDETIKMLDELCDVYSRDKTSIIETLINAEYYKATKVGQQKLKDMVKSLGLVNDTINEFTKVIK